METKHTPGPWFFDLAGHTGAMIVDSEGDHIVDLVVTSNTTAQSALPANAQLIAAAPDLLRVLQLIHANAGESPEWIRARVDPIIARATGNQ